MLLLLSVVSLTIPDIAVYPGLTEQPVLQIHHGIGGLKDLKSREVADAGFCETIFRFHALLIIRACSYPGDSDDILLL